MRCCCHLLTSLKRELLVSVHLAAVAHRIMLNVVYSVLCVECTSIYWVPIVWFTCDIYTQGSRDATD
jgi:hypothetical protein